jgi:RES domain-containing protein
LKWPQVGDFGWPSGEHDNRVLIYGWRRFVDHVKHRQRYFFTTTERELGQDIEPSRLMPALGAVVSELGLIQVVPADTPLFRVRLRSAADKWPLDLANLGAPPAEKMTAGRMNPPGIRYLYVALEERTAVAEVVRGPPCSFAVAEFRAREDVTVLDLTQLPALPSMFDYERLREREFLLFLEHFVEAISRPVIKDGNEHVEYVPTQIVCEYFASVFRKDGASLNGILYPSAVRPSGRNLVLFPHFDDEDPFACVALSGAKQVNTQNWPTLQEML